jgi:uncharacterized lipoprotein YmbA
MHHHHLKHWVALWGLLALVSGCASAPSRFYTLSAESAATPSSSNLSVVVGPVSVPASVDRPEIVVSTGPNQLRLEELDRWASPLQDEIARAVAENLIGMLHTPHVTLASQDLGAGARYRVVIGVQKLESMPGEAAALDAAWSVRRTKDRKTITGRTTVRETLRKPGYEALVAAHSRTVARLSRDIANAIRSLDRSAS